MKSKKQIAEEIAQLLIMNEAFGNQDIKLTRLQRKVGDVLFDEAYDWAEQMVFNAKKQLY